MPNETDNQEIDVQIEQQEADAEVASSERNEDVKDDETKDAIKETDETKKTGVMSFIKNIIKGTPDGDVDDGGEGDDIPSEFAEAAIKAGWSEEQIKDFTSDYTDDELREQIPYLGTPSVDSDKSEQPAKKEGDVQQQVEQKDVVPLSQQGEDKAKDDEKDAVIAKLTERLDKLEKGQQENIEQDAQAKLESQLLRASERMDELSKEFEIFGTVKTLPRFPDGRVIPSSPQAKARYEVVGLALDLHMKAGMDFEQALSTSLNAFKGKNLVKDVKRNLVKNLKKSEKKLSAKHTSHESVKSDLSGPDVIREVGKKHGLEIR